MNAKSFFLTFSQCPATKEFFLNHIKERAEQKQPGARLLEFVIGEELHADGGKHLHAYFKFSTAIRGTMLLWDFEYNGERYHGNSAGTVRNAAACKNYCRKDGNFIEVSIYIFFYLESN